jgi:Uma2 family endonuclease
VISPESTFGELITKAKVYAEAGVATYWVIDPLGDTISLTEMVLEEAPRQYAIARHTTDVFTTERPHPVILDLPALTARRAALVERVKP